MVVFLHKRSLYCVWSCVCGRSSVVFCATCLAETCKGLIHRSTWWNSILILLIWGNEALGFVNGSKYVAEVSDYRLLKEHTTARSLLLKSDENDKRKRRPYAIQQLYSTSSVSVFSARGGIKPEMLRLPKRGARPKNTASASAANTFVTRISNISWFLATPERNTSPSTAAKCRQKVGWRRKWSVPYEASFHFRAKAWRGPRPTGGGQDGDIRKWIQLGRTYRHNQNHN
jgi:hypothetical protein